MGTHLIDVSSAIGDGNHAADAESVGAVSVGGAVQAAALGARHASPTHCRVAIRRALVLLWMGKWAFDFREFTKKNILSFAFWRRKGS